MGRFLNSSRTPAYSSIGISPAVEQTIMRLPSTTHLHTTVFLAMIDVPGISYQKEVVSGRQ